LYKMYPKEFLSHVLLMGSLTTLPFSSVSGQTEITSRELYSVFQKKNLNGEENVSFEFFMGLLDSFVMDTSAEFYDAHILMSYTNWEEYLVSRPDLHAKTGKLWHTMITSPEFSEVNPAQLRFFLLACIFGDEFIENAMVDPQLYSHYGFTGKSMRGALSQFFNSEDGPWLNSFTFEDK
ncbi:MAG TPA: hypothetical protein PKD96_04270, partial [Candidatus Absconditabacterales bacterium]|nr:hypothetical protein [Candidatus Absconditabacterales bacterium]